MRIYIIGNDGITLCREAPATLNDGEVATGPSPRRRPGWLCRCRDRAAQTRTQTASAVFRWVANRVRRRLFAGGSRIRTPSPTDG